MKKLLMFLGILLVLPICVHATTVDEQLANKKLEIKSIPITNAEELYFILEEYSYYGDDGMYWYGVDVESCNEEVTKCNFTKSSFDENDHYQQDTFNDVKISYVYDADVKKIVDDILKDFPDDASFALTDIEFLKYYVDTMESDNYLNMGTYSSALKKAVGYKNFEIEPRLGDEGPLYWAQGGNATFKYNGTIYASKPLVMITGRHIVYLPKGTTDIKKALEDKLGKYFKVEDVTSIGSKETFLNEMRAGEIEYFNSYYYQYAPAGMTADQFADDFMNSYFYGEDAPMKIIADCEDEMYNVTLNGYGLDLLVLLTDENTDPTFTSNDILSDVTIETDSYIPLDTLIQVAKLTSGTEYDKIVNVLNSSNIDVFDLKLFAKSTGSYVTKLDNGTFQVKLPIKEEFKNQDIKLYYINEAGEKEEIPVTISGDYAVFETNHFSTYTLVAEPKTSNNPPTGDNFNKYITLLIISLMGTLTILYQTKKNLN